MSHQRRWTAPALFVAVTLALAGGMIYQQQRLNTQQAELQTEPHTLLPADIKADLTRIPLAAWDRARTDDIRPLAITTDSSMPPQPTVLYIGAEYCPYCAAMKWALVTALNRFGTFNGLALSLSSAHDIFPLTPTLALAHARYESPYVTAQTIETEGKAPGQALPLTPIQVAALHRLDPSGAIPFLLIGNRYLLIGSPYSPAILHGANWHIIAAQLFTATTPTARIILGAGNEISLAICLSNGMRPTGVCRSDGVQRAEAVIAAR